MTNFGWHYGKCASSGPGLLGGLVIGGLTLAAIAETKPPPPPEPAAAPAEPSVWDGVGATFAAIGEGAIYAAGFVIALVVVLGVAAWWNVHNRPPATPAARPAVEGASVEVVGIARTDPPALPAAIPLPAVTPTTVDLEEIHR